MGYGAWEGGVHDGVSLCFFCGHRRAGGPCTVCGYAAVVERAYDSTRACPRERFVCFFSRAGISAHEHRGGHHGFMEILLGPESSLTRKKSRFMEILLDPRVVFQRKKKSRFRFFWQLWGE